MARDRPESLDDVVRQLKRLAARQPGRRLLAAMLLDAIEDVRRGDDAGHGRRADAVAWVSATDVRWPLSFVSVCGALDVDAVALRAMLLGRSAIGSASTAPRLRW